MDPFLDYKNNLITYLKEEKAFIEEDIIETESLSREEKINKGYVIPDLILKKRINDEFLFECEENNSKLRPGDRVHLVSKKFNKKEFIEAIVLENGNQDISLICKQSIKYNHRYDLLVKQFNLNDPIINLLEKTHKGSPGSLFLELLAKQLVTVPMFHYGRTFIFNPEYFNIDSSKIDAIKKGLQLPAIMNIQGPPGTGKTNVLAILSGILISKIDTLIIIAPTHQAVNNALNKIKEIFPDQTIFKVGEQLKSVSLIPGIETVNFRKLSRESMAKKMKKRGSCSKKIIGMTFHASMINLGFLKSNFYPEVILVEEAGQLALTYAAALGAFGAGSIFFIGDDKQMPPIFHRKLASNALSISVFEHIKNLYHDIVFPLRVTYRLNNQITPIIDELFYRTDEAPFFESSEFSANRRLDKHIHSQIKWVNTVINDPYSIFWVNVPLNDSRDFNQVESESISTLLKECLTNNFSKESISVITPYRRQVISIRRNLSQVYNGQQPIIDTVERLQGQDVDVIIISLCSDNYEYIKSQENFLFNKNRLNVMLSRAKLKIIIFGNENLLIYDLIGKFNILTKICSASKKISLNQIQ